MMRPKDENLRFCASKVGRFGAVSEAKESAKHFLELLNEGGFSRYPLLSVIKMDFSNKYVIINIHLILDVNTIGAIHVYDRRRSCEPR